MKKALVALGVLALLSTTPALAQETIPTQVGVTTPYVGVAAKPGTTATFPIEVGAPPNSRARLSVEGLPEGWTSQIQGGGFIVDEVQLDATGQVHLDLNVDIPEDAAEKTYSFDLKVTSGTDVETVAFSLRVAQEAAGTVSMATEFPSLKGDSDSSYSFNVDLENGTPQQVEFALGADAPSGWDVEVQPGGEAKAATVTVDGGGTSRLTVNVTPPDAVEAGVYTITPRAEGDGQSASVELTIEITGSFAIDLTTANGVLSTPVHGGSPTDVDLIVTNTGTAPLVGIQLSSSKPSSWDVSYSPEAIDALAPGASATVTATITPSDQAINGDYVVTLTSGSQDVSTSVDIRTTLETSAVWGLVGVGVIVIALIGLSLIFRRYGRR